MSRQLDRLVQKYKRGIDRTYYTRHYSILLEKAEEIEKAEDELLDLDYDIENMPDNNSDLKSESLEGKASFILKNPKDKFLSKLFSDVNRITCSRQLSKKLINYYLRNRRKHNRMSKAYSQKLSYTQGVGNISVDYMLHEMYMRLGKTLYFSFWGKVKDNIKNAAFKFMGIAADLIIGLVGAGFLSAGFYNFFKKVTYIFAKFLAKILSLFMDFNPNLPAQQLFTAVILGILSGIGIWLTLRGLLTLAVGDDEEALRVYNKGRRIYKKIKSALRKGLPKKLGTKGILALALRITNNESNALDIQKTIEAIESIDEKVREFMKHKMDSNFIEAIEKASKFSVSARALVSENLKSLVSMKSGQKIALPNEIVLREFVVYKDSSSKNELESSSQSNDSEVLPAGLMPVVLITSPKIQVHISVEDSKLTIQFNASGYFGHYAELEKDEIKDFVLSYLDIYNRDEDRKRLEEIQKHLQ